VQIDGSERVWERVCDPVLRVKWVVPAKAIIFKHTFVQSMGKFAIT
jgi:hypothetical protein